MHHIALSCNFNTMTDKKCDFYSPGCIFCNKLIAIMIVKNKIYLLPKVTNTLLFKK